jgi:hypothetical protein
MGFTDKILPLRQPYTYFALSFERNKSTKTTKLKDCNRIIYERVQRENPYLSLDFVNSWNHIPYV